MAVSEASLLRTPESRFAVLPGFPYEPHYLKKGNLRMAYVDETNSTAGDVLPETFLCIHGQPTWSYLYRRMIPILLSYTGRDEALSRRVVAPDLFGFGRSDKPVDESVYSFDFHRESLLHLIHTLNLQNVTLVVQDWGGLLGLTLPVAEPETFKRLIVMNTTIAIGETITPGFSDWRTFINRSPDLNVGRLLVRSCKHVSDTEKQAYDAPFPDEKYKAGVRRFPNMVMTEPGMSGIEISQKSVSFFKQKDHFRTQDIFMACGSQDRVFGVDVMHELAGMWKNGCYYMDIPQAGHFVQEWGDQVAMRAIQVFESSNAVITIDGVRKVKSKSTKL